MEKQATSLNEFVEMKPEVCDVQGIKIKEELNFVDIKYEDFQEEETSLSLESVKKEEFIEQMEYHNFYCKSHSSTFRWPLNPGDSEDSGSSDNDDSVVDKDYVPILEEESSDEELVSTHPDVSDNASADIATTDNGRRKVWKKEDIRHFSVATMQSNYSDKYFMSPLQYLNSFFDEEMIFLIVYETNLNFLQKDPNCIHTTNTNEIKDFLSILIYMGVTHCPSIDDYWNSYNHISFISETMSLKRFKVLGRFVHFSDNSKSVGSEDRFFKIRPLFECLRKNCLRVAPTYHQSIGEVMVAYKGTRASNLRQYKKNKPNKWGFKLFCRGSSDGIIHDFILYQGANTFINTDLSDEELNNGLGAKVASILCKTIANPECTVVYGDNFFTSIGLINHLHKCYKLHYVGTIQSNRLKGVTLQADTDLKKRSRGSYDYKSNEDIILVKWFDNKCVTLASNAVGISPACEIIRYDEQQKQKVPVQCPAIIKAYEDHMGGIDISDALIHLYKTQCKSKRWYLRLFGYIIDLSICNAWLLYKRVQREMGETKIKCLKSFRLEVSDNLRKAGRPAIMCAGSLLSLPNSKKKRKHRVIRPTTDVRYDQVGHFPIHDRKKQRCKHCSNGVSRWKCSKCSNGEMYLCLNEKKNCFFEFHRRPS